MLAIPEHLMGVRYNGSVYPGAGVQGLDDGANCQVFAYALLEHHGVDAPRLRSSELWEDSTRTIAVATYQPLDLLLFHSSPDAYGAHLTVYVGEGRVVHLARHHGIPVVESIDDLTRQPRYRFFIGAKRVI